VAALDRPLVRPAVAEASVVSTADPANAESTAPTLALVRSDQVEQEDPEEPLESESQHVLSGLMVPGELLVEPARMAPSETLSQRQELMLPLVSASLRVTLDRTARTAEEAAAEAAAVVAMEDSVMLIAAAVAAVAAGRVAAEAPAHRAPAAVVPLGSTRFQHP
jgi:hypothetical protein